MKYSVTCLTKSYTIGDFTITAGETKEVDEKLYVYLNTTFGDAGWFTFSTQKTEVKAKPKATTKAKAQPKEQEAPKTSKRRKSTTVEEK